MLREVAEVAIARDQRDVVIDAGLGDERLGEPGAEPFARASGGRDDAARVRSFGKKLQRRDRPEDHRPMVRGQRWFRQHLRENHRRQGGFAGRQGRIEELNVRAAVTLDVGDQRGAIDRCGH